MKSSTLAAIFCVFLLVLGSCVTASAFKLPDTGQMTCYGDYIVINCPAPGGWLAQDGSYSINPMSYTDKSNGTVTDNNTGLMWQKQDDGDVYNWYQASGTYDTTDNPMSQSVCGSLSLGGHADWRLPSEKELMGIVNYGIPGPGPTIETTYFPNTQASYYWSSTPYASNPSSAWNVNFYNGYVLSSQKSNSLYSYEKEAEGSGLLLCIWALSCPYACFRFAMSTTPAGESKQNGPAPSPPSGNRKSPDPNPRILENHDTAR